MSVCLLVLFEKNSSFPRKKKRNERMPFGSFRKELYILFFIANAINPISNSAKIAKAV
jgi:hypothetical protein